MDIFNAFDNAFGGHDFQVDNHSYQTRENIFNGQDIYENGQLVAATKPNIFNGVDMHNSQNELIVSTKSNVFGGHDIVSGHGEFEGYTTHDAMGTTFHDPSGTLSTIPFDQSNATTILNYQDPLAHIGSYVLPTLIL
jgi:hypothetical protein